MGVQILSTLLYPFEYRQCWQEALGICCFRLMLNKLDFHVSSMICCTTYADYLFSFQLKTQLTKTLSKLETEENERQRVAGDLYKVRLLLLLFYICMSGMAPNSRPRC